MADNYTGLATVKPTGPSSDAYQNITPVPLANPGMRTAEGLEAFSRGARELGLFFDAAAADDASNQYQERVNEIMHGVPGKMVPGPDGKTMVPDSGYMGLQGRSALDAREATDRRMEDLRKELRGNLSMRQAKQFDADTRRLKAISDSRMGQHADNQFKVWNDQVDKASISNWSNKIAMNAEDPTAVLEGRENLRRVMVERAERVGGGPELIKDAVDTADRMAVESQASAIAIRDPQKAMRIIENNRAALGTRYDELANRFRSKAETADGRDLGDRLLSGSPPPVGDDAKAVVRHFEGFREKAYWDVNHHRVGYGSDTVTKADGTVVPVTAETTVTKEDAERDLERRLGKSQGVLRQQIGTEAWDKLSPQAKASLTSIIYNYGDAGVPQGVIDAAKTGDPKKISDAIRGLSKGAGVNTGRRISEANNIMRGEAEPRSQAEMLSEVDAMNVPPTTAASAKARINQSYAQREKAEVKRETEFKQRTDDTLAESWKTGQPPVNPQTEYDFVSHHGPSKGTALYTQYRDNIDFNVDRYALERMPDAAQFAYLNDRLEKAPQPGAPGYANAMAKQGKLQTEVEKIQKTRREDPSAAVEQTDAVKEARAMVAQNPKDPAAHQRLAATRMVQQEKLGIEPEFRSPISKAEAMKEMTPVLMALPGQKADAFEKLGERYRLMFGDHAAQAFLYSLRAAHIVGEKAAETESIVQDLMSSAPISKQEKRAARDAAATEAMRPSGVGGASGAPAAPGDQPAWMESPEYSPSGSYQPPAPKKDVPRSIPNNQDMRDLRDNKRSDAEFDQAFGPGAAKKLREEFPAFFRKP